MRRNLLLIQVIILGAGLVFSWSKVLVQFQTFYHVYGTLFKIKDCSFPNPLVTACFYGSLMFLFTFIWGLNLYFQPVLKEKNEIILRNLLAFGSVFALSVLTYEFLLYYKIIKITGNIISCSPGVYPLRTPCFTGMLFFVAAFLTAAKIVRLPPDKNLNDISKP